MIAAKYRPTDKDASSLMKTATATATPRSGVKLPSLRQILRCTLAASVGASTKVNRMRPTMITTVTRITTHDSRRPDSNAMTSPSAPAVRVTDPVAGLGERVGSHATQRPLVVGRQLQVGRSSRA